MTCLRLATTDLLLPEVLERVSDVLARYAHCWITTVDSDRNVQAMPELLAALQGTTRECEQARPGLVAETRAVLSLAAQDWFHGFDELWFLDDPPTAAAQEDLSIVPPLEPTPAFMASLEQWMHAAGASFGLSGGLGCYFAATDIGMLREVRRQLGDATRIREMIPEISEGRGGWEGPA